MKIYAGAPLLALAICFNLIDLSSQFNTSALQIGQQVLPYDLGIYYMVTDDETVMIEEDGNRVVNGLLDGQKLVCAFEPILGGPIVRMLMQDGVQVKADKEATFNWAATDSQYYDIDFDQPLPKKTPSLEEEEDVEEEEDDEEEVTQ